MNRKSALAPFAFFFIFWFGLLFFSGSLTSGFHFTDDHQIISYSETLKSAGAIETALKWVADDASSIGRFLPVYYIHRLLQIKFFGTDFLLWGLYDGLLAWLSSSFMATFMLLAGFSLFEALLFPCLLFLGFQTGIWWRFGTAETIAMLILAVMLTGAAAGAKKRCRILDILFIAAGILLMLTKETFILFIPALLFMKVWLAKKERHSGWLGALKEEALPVALLLALAGAEVLFIKFFVGTTGIGYAGYEGFKTGPFISAFVNYLFASQAWLVPMGFVLALSATPRDRRPWGDIAAVFILLVLSLLPQTALHAKSGVSERYILPGVFGVVFASFYFLRLTREGLSNGRPGLKWSTLASWAVALACVVLGSYMISHRKLTITFALENLSLLSEVDPVPFLSFVTAWFHGFTQKTFLWIASGALILSAVAARGATISRFLNQRTFLGFALLWTTLFDLTIGFDNAFLSAFQGRKTNEWLRSIEENTGKDDLILVVADPAMNNEWALSIKRYLSIESGRTNLYSYPVLTKSAYTPFEKTLIDSFGSIYPGRDVSNVPDVFSIKAVAVFPGAEDAFLAASSGWFASSMYSKYINEYGFVSYYRAR
jgi:hypothetical protein